MPEKIIEQQCTYWMFRSGGSSKKRINTKLNNDRTPIEDSIIDSFDRVMVDAVSIDGKDIVDDAIELTHEDRQINNNKLPYWEKNSLSIYPSYKITTSMVLLREIELWNIEMLSMAPWAPPSALLIERGSNPP